MESVKEKYILIDTNILVYCAEKTFGQGTKKLLRKLKDQNNTLSTSEACCFELIKNAHDINIRNYYFKLIDYIDKLKIHTDYLLNGCILYHEYKKRNMGVATGKGGVESMDLIVSGTVMYHTESLLLTANRKHYPAPYWKMVARDYIIYSQGESNSLINIYLLEFDYTELKKSLAGKDSSRNK